MSTADILCTERGGDAMSQQIAENPTPVAEDVHLREVRQFANILWSLNSLASGDIPGRKLVENGSIEDTETGYLEEFIVKWVMENQHEDNPGGPRITLPSAIDLQEMAAVLLRLSEAEEVLGYNPYQR
jgi:hypothetical protein